MQPDFRETVCILCVNIISDTNCEVIENFAKEVVEVVLPDLNLEEKNKHFICKACSVKLFRTFNFKSACMGTEDLLISYVNANNRSVTELKDVYLKTNGNIQVTDVLENQKICRLCLQLVMYGFVSLNEVDDLIKTYIPQVNINATEDPVICNQCFDSLHAHGGFLKNCRDAWEKYKSADKGSYIKIKEDEIKPEEVNYNTQQKCEDVDGQSYIKSEKLEIKLEVDGDVQEEYKSIDNQFSVKSEEIEIKSEEPDQDGETFLYNPDEEKIEMYKCDICTYQFKYKSCVKQHQVCHKDSSDIKMKKCDTCYFEAKYKIVVTRHQLMHKNISEIQMYKCDSCSYETKFKRRLREHQLKHKDNSEIQTYKCGSCTYETKYKRILTRHQVMHRKNSEIQMYKCDECNYETKFKCNLKPHQLLHKDPSETKMYKCDMCSYETRYKSVRNRHQLLMHKDPSEIKMNKCDICDFETKLKSNLKLHQILHKDPSEIQMYKCHACNYENKYKKNLKNHQLTHEKRNRDTVDK